MNPRKIRCFPDKVQSKLRLRDGVGGASAAGKPCNLEGLARETAGAIGSADRAGGSHAGGDADGRGSGDLAPRPALVESVCCLGNPHVDPDFGGRGWGPSPLRSLATGLWKSGLLRPGRARKLLCTVSIQALTNPSGAAVTTFGETAVSELNATAARLCGVERGIPGGDPLVAATTPWVQRLNHCISNFVACRNPFDRSRSRGCPGGSGLSRAAEQYRAWHEAPADLVGCIKAVPPIATAPHAPRIAPGDIIDWFRAELLAVANPTEQWWIARLIAELETADHGGADGGLLPSLDGLMAALATIQGDLSESNAAVVDVDPESPAVAAINKGCDLFCARNPATNKTAPHTMSTDGVAAPAKPRKHKQDDSPQESKKRLKKHDPIGMQLRFRMLVSVFGGIEVMYSPNSTSITELVRVANGAFADLSLLVHLALAYVAFDSIATAQSGQRDAVLVEQWWGIPEDRFVAARESANAPNPWPGHGLHGPDWTMVATPTKPRIGSLNFDAEAFRAQLVRKVTATVTVDTTGKYCFETAAVCESWNRCAVYSGLCSCSTTIRYGNGTHWGHMTPNANVTPCTAEYLEAGPDAPNPARCECSRGLRCYNEVWLRPPGARQRSSRILRLDGITIDRAHAEVRWQPGGTRFLADGRVEASSAPLTLQAGAPYTIEIKSYNAFKAEHLGFVLRFLPITAGDSTVAPVRWELPTPVLMDDSNGTTAVIGTTDTFPRSFPSIAPKFQGHVSEANMVAAVQAKWQRARGVHFGITAGLGDPSAEVAYRIRSSSDLYKVFPSTRNVGRRPIFSVWGKWTWEVYQWAFTPYLIDMLDRSIAAIRMDAYFEAPALFATKMPTPPYNAGHFMYNVDMVLPLLLVLAWIYSVSITAKSIVHENEARLRESLKIMGLTDMLSWLGWFVVSFAVSTTTAVIIAALLTFGNVLETTSFSVVLLLLVLFANATVSLSLLLSTFFAKARVASACAGLIYFCMFLPYIYFRDREGDTPWAITMLCSLFAPSALGFGCSRIADYELAAEGANWDNIGQTVDGDGKITMAQIMWMLALDSVLYLVFAYWIDQVFPGAFGLGRHPLFFLEPVAALCRSVPWLVRFKGLSIQADNLGDDRNGYSMSNGGEDEGNLNCEENFGRCHISGTDVTIAKLCKSYRRSGGRRQTVHALSDVDLELVHGQLTSLLGSNGAGKSTLISILTGLIPPSSGSITVGGHDHRRWLPQIRRAMGMCPQHNVIFGWLTVAEHLKLCTTLRRITASTLPEAAEEADQLLDDLGLAEKRDTLARELSGGMKRKLCLAMAYVGNSSIIVLDEPTAGMDPQARRLAWDLILKRRKEQCVLLATHHLDEADILSDRIACIFSGKIVCAGTAASLKRAHCRGYTLECGYTAGADPSAIISLAKSHVQGCEVIKTATDSGTGVHHMQVLLPYDETSHFEQLLLELEDQKQALKLGSFAISAPTLEDMFLGVASTAVASDLNLSPPICDSPSSEQVHRFGFTSGRRAGNTDPRPASLVGEDEDDDVALLGDDLDHSSTGGDFNRSMSGMALHLAQGLALLKRRALYTSRDRRAVFSQLILPVIFVLVAMLVATSLPADRPEPELSIEPELYASDLHPPGHMDVPIATHECKASFASADAVQAKGVEACFFPVGSVAVPTPAGVVAGVCPAARLVEVTSNCSNMTEFLLFSGKMRADRNLAIRGGVTTGRKSLSDPDVILASVLRPDWANVPEKQPSETFVNALFDSRYYHSFPTFVHYANQGLLNAGTPRTVGGSNTTTKGSTQAAIFPVPRRWDRTALRFLKSGTDMIVTIFLLLALSFIPASFVVLLVQERTAQCRHLEYSAGLPPLVFWSTSFLFDLVCFVLSASIVVLVLLAFGLPAYTGRNLGVVAALHYLYGWAITPLMYAASNLFQVPTSAYVTLIIGNLMIGLTSTLSYFVIALFIIPDDETSGSVQLEHINNVLKSIFLCSPHFAFGRGLLDVAKNEYEAQGREFLAQLLEQPTPAFSDPFGWSVAGPSITALGIEGFVYFGLAVYADKARRLKKESLFAGVLGHGKATRLSEAAGVRIAAQTESDMSNDVAIERERVVQMANVVRREADFAATVNSGTTPDALLVEEITKQYNPKAAHVVGGVSFGVKSGEVFGLLGVNGAGKSTLFKMLTGDMAPSSGRAYVCGNDVATRPGLVQRHIGYCPQLDALFGLLSAREHLEYFAALRGIPGHQRSQAATELLRFLRLIAFADVLTATLSGGNKRKLQVAIAVIGGPSVIFLDEPTAGMDPLARSFLSSQVKAIARTGSSVVLTSHSMEECEALCTRMTIMLGGILRCVGSPGQIRRAHGQGYTITIDFDLDAQGEEDNLAVARRFVLEKFRNSFVEEEHHRRLVVGLPLIEPAEVAGAFKIIEKRKAELSIADYSIGRTSLEAVFCRLARAEDSNSRHGVRLHSDSEPESDHAMDVQLSDRCGNSSSVLENRAFDYNQL